MRKMVIGLIGLGTVGGGLVDLLQKNAKEIEQRTGKTIFLKWAAVHNLNKPRTLPKETKLTNNPMEIILDEEVQIVVEVMGGLDRAYDIIHAALENGKSVVTANKALLAERGEELFSLAEKNKLCLAYEASIAGAIPIVQTIKDSLAGNKITCVTGILNGTSNYILSQMSDNNTTFDQALKNAQELGFAEADPTLDIDGQDAAHKLKLLIRLAWGVHYPYEQLTVRGIRKMDIRDIHFAKELGFAIKLLGQAEEIDSKIKAGVEPFLVGHKTMLARVDNAFNAIHVKGNAVGSLFLHGLGAGSLPTASAILGDIISLMRDTHDNTGYISTTLPLAKFLDSKEAISPWYLRLMVRDDSGVLRDIAGSLAKQNVSIAQVIQKKSCADAGAPLVFMTHKTSALSIHNSLEELEKSGMILSKSIAYRVLDEE